MVRHRATRATRHIGSGPGRRAAASTADEMHCEAPPSHHHRTTMEPPPQLQLHVRGVCFGAAAQAAQ